MAAVAEEGVEEEAEDVEGEEGARWSRRAVRRARTRTIHQNISMIISRNITFIVFTYYIAIIFLIC